jgi:hypothetical protein
MGKSEFFPWLKHLDEAHRREFFADISRVAYEVSVSVNARMDGLDSEISSWKSTAEVHADPELYAALTSAIEGKDFGPVLLPAGCLDPELCTTAARCPNCDPEGDDDDQ